MRKSTAVIELWVVTRTGYITRQAALKTVHSLGRETIAIYNFRVLSQSSISVGGGTPDVVDNN